MSEKAHTAVNVWVEVSTKISSQVTLSYGALELGRGEATIFLGHSPGEMLVNIQRLQDELEGMRHRLNAE